MSCAAVALLVSTDARGAEIRYDPELSRHDAVFAKPEDARGLGVLVVAGKRPQLFMKNEVLFHPRNSEDLAGFLRATRGQLVEEALPPRLPRLENERDRAAFEGRHRLIRFDPREFDLRALDGFASRNGVRGEMRFKDEASARTLAAGLALAAKGFRVELNAVARSNQALLTRTAEAGGADAFTANGFASGTDSAGNGLTNVSRAWQLMVAAGITARTRIAIIDSGFWVNGGVAGDAQGQADFPQIVLTWNVIANNDDASGTNVMTCGGNACDWHGYQAASVAAALPNNNAGVAGSGGFVADPLFIRVGGTAYQQVRAAWIAYLAGAKVINMSLNWDCSVGCSLAFLVGEDPRTQLQEAVSWFEQNGTVVVAAAGNDNQDVNSEHVYPCRAVSVCVGATSGAINQPAAYSNYGGSVTIFAPTDLKSLIPGSTKDFGGTSAAAPLVSGVIAMMLATDPTASVARIRAALIDSAWTQPIAAGGGKVDRWLNAYAAVLEMLNWRIRDDDTESRGALALPAAGSNVLSGRTISSQSDVDRYTIDVTEYSSLSAKIAYMKALNPTRFGIARTEPFKDFLGPEGTSSIISDTEQGWRADLVPPGQYTVTVSGIVGPNLYDLTTEVQTTGLQPDQFDGGGGPARGGIFAIPNNDNAPFAATLKPTDVYLLTLHKPDGSDVDYFRVAGGDRMMAGFTSERPIDIELSDANGTLIERRTGVLSAIIAVYQPADYLIRISGRSVTRYYGGVGKLPVLVRPLRERFRPKLFDPRDPEPKIVFLPNSEHIFRIPKADPPRGPISIAAPGYIELISADRVARVIAASKQGSDGLRTLEFPTGLPARDYYLRIRRDDRNRDIGMQPLAVLKLQTSQVAPNRPNR